MALILKWSGDGLSPGTLSTSSAGAGDTAPTQISLNSGTTATIVSEGSRAPGIQLSEPAVGASGWIDWNFSPSSTVSARLYFTPSGTLATNHTIFSLRAADESRIADINITGTGAVRVYDVDNNYASIGAGGEIAIGTTYRFELILDAITGVLSIAIFNNHSTTALLSQATVVGNFIAPEVGCLRLGKNTTTQQAETQLWDDIHLTSDQAFIGPSSIITTISAGGDQEGVVALRTISLSAEVLTGSVTSWVWQQVSGPSVVLSGTGHERTFIAPAGPNGAVLGFQVVANSSITENITVTVLPHLDWIATEEGLQPLRSSLDLT